MKMNLGTMAQKVSAIAVSAGLAIMEVYHGDNLDVELKQDSSPLTRADLASHQVIAEGLILAFPDLPLLSEESESFSGTQRQDWFRYWLIDPLDGTKEFIKRNGEFTVNIALIEGGNPVMGVVYAPALDRLYWGYDSSAWCKQGSEAARAIHVIRKDEAGALFKVVVSRSHRSAELERFLENLSPHECVAMGSSLKLCLVAEGNAHLYPRIGPTMEWDTAAADAIVRAAGGTVTTLNGEPLSYNKYDLRNPYFLVKSQAEGV
ncbi:MAG: 3'(2'),5'-bisphosphate nucleotidase CysQ [Methylococcales bacterium]